MDLVIGSLDLAAHVDEALSVQALAFGLGPEEVAVRRQIVQRHMQYPGARAFGA
ncbi:GNAT family N-acetyltransferase, partial [Streptomyces sp. SAS_269]